LSLAKLTGPLKNHSCNLQMSIAFNEVINIYVNKLTFKGHVFSFLCTTSYIVQILDLAIIRWSLTYSAVLIKKYAI